MVLSAISKVVSSTISLSEGKTSSLFCSKSSNSENSDSTESNSTAFSFLISLSEVSVMSADVIDRVSSNSSSNDKVSISETGF